MKLPKKSRAKIRPIVISSLAAKLLGSSRVGGAAVSTDRLSTTFPAFNVHELSNAVNELLDKQLFKQTGAKDHATYSLTDCGRDGPIAVV